MPLQSRDLKHARHCGESAMHVAAGAQFPSGAAAGALCFLQIEHRATTRTLVHQRRLYTQGKNPSVTTLLGEQQIQQKATAARPCSARTWLTPSRLSFWPSAEAAKKAKPGALDPCHCQTKRNCSSGMAPTSSRSPRIDLQQLLSW